MTGSWSTRDDVDGGADEDRHGRPADQRPEERPDRVGEEDRAEAEEAPRLHRRDPRGRLPPAPAQLRAAHQDGSK